VHPRFLRDWIRGLHRDLDRHRDQDLQWSESRARDVLRIAAGVPIAEPWLEPELGALGAGDCGAL